MKTTLNMLFYGIKHLKTNNNDLKLKTNYLLQYIFQNQLPSKNTFTPLFLVPFPGSQLQGHYEEISLLLATISPGVTSTHLVDFGRIKGVCKTWFQLVLFNP